MRLVLFTWPEFFAGEAAQLVDLLKAGADVVHLRKPQATIEQCARLLDELPEEWHGRIVVHDHFELLRDYGLKGVCLNGRRATVPAGLNPGAVCCGCHSLAELCAKKAVADAGAGKPFEYMFLSPIYDSISKNGYVAAFDARQLDAAAQSGLIDDRVVALGGVTADKLSQLERWHFGGLAVLGAVWKQPVELRAKTVEKLKNRE